MDYTSQHDEVKMAPNPAYGPVSAITVKTESHYEEVGPPTDDHSN